MKANATILTISSLSSCIFLFSWSPLLLSLPSSLSLVLSPTTTCCSILRSGSISGYGISSPTTLLHLQSNSDSNGGEEEDITMNENEILSYEESEEDCDNDETLEAIVKRKKGKNKGKKNGYVGYKPIDNRDALPFVVKEVTPDPYKKRDIMKHEAKMNTKVHKKKNKNKGKNTRDFDEKQQQAKKKNRASGINIKASLFKRNEDGTNDKILGEFELDKSTNCGDLLEVGDREYEVMKARCQYKYAGGQKFVMVRKILEVKEVTRIATENYLARQMQLASSFDNNKTAYE
eukprot:CAMPEP_0178961860 /NCGR_PEP_ID=MMETSP0789-20121207/13986_1 /TAXON_ID=3005 /ORGANISM="Rhizosolenia setigera, Strain CCMP 1694" /LENGTH=289 /DNA_ID=CAMNT_0020645831 /DNA_START=39 /DNA_END=908 /DNA_ORIENTATION=+